MATSRKPRARNGPWRLEEAKARFSEVVRLARDVGPQHVTYRGSEAVVVVSADEYQRLSNRRPKTSLVKFLQGTSLVEIDVVRNEDRGRDVDL